MIDEQQPVAAILTCSDSRISPEIVFDQGLGDLFVIRNAGNLVDEFVLRSIEFALTALKVQLVIVMGHTGCAAVMNALGSKTPDTHLKPIYQTIRSNIHLPKDPAMATIDAIRANILASREHISQSPVIHPFCRSKSVQIVGTIYRLENGRVEIL